MILLASKLFTFGCGTFAASETQADELKASKNPLAKSMVDPRLWPSLKSRP